MDQEEAKTALAAMDQAKGRLADGMQVPMWRHLAFGGLMGSLVLGVTAPSGWFAPIFVGSMAAMVWLLRHDRARYGVFVSGYRRGRTLPIALGLLAIELAIIHFGVPSRHLPFPSLRGALCVLAAFCVAVGASILFQRVYQTELRDEQS